MAIKRHNQTTPSQRFLTNTLEEMHRAKSLLDIMVVETDKNIE